MNEREERHEDATRIMTLGEVADYLRVPQATLYCWRYRGVGPIGVRVGRHIRYSRSEVDRWFNNGGSRPT
jgi:excisionase family DNA binding protein